MAKFKYKFESVKKVKKILEKKAQKELMEAEAEILRVKDKITDTNLKKNKSKKEFLNRVHHTVNEMKFQQNYEKYLDEQVENFRQELEELYKQREERLKELAEKSKEHKIFDKLKEKNYNDFMAEENKKELLEIDEIASIRYNKK